MSSVVEQTIQLGIVFRQAVARLHDGCKAPDFVSLKEAARLSGFSAGTLRNWVAQGIINPGNGLGYSGTGERPRIRIDRAVFLHWISAGRPATVPLRLVKRSTQYGFSATHKRQAGSRV